MKRGNEMKYKIIDRIAGEIIEADDFEVIKEQLLRIIEENPCSQMTYDHEKYEWEIKWA